MTPLNNSIALTDYRFIGVDTVGRVISLQWISCADDVEACSIAAGMIAESDSVEVWDVGRKVSVLGGAQRPS